MLKTKNVGIELKKSPDFLKFPWTLKFLPDLAELSPDRTGGALPRITFSTVPSASSNTTP